ncbi:MAG: CDP-alcohol phosphatidyltransferase family protein [Mucilaginibacter sp.]
MSSRAYYFLNAITFYRMIVAPLLILLAIYHQFEIFKWLLAASFFTDAIDGYLARRYKVISKFGASIDSIADDLTVAAAIIGMIAFKPDFLKDQIILIIVLVLLYLLQIILALVRYKKISSFHTYFAKIAAILQGAFIILFFFLPAPVYPLFYIMAVATIVDLLEEIGLVLILPHWQANVKGLYWIIKNHE